MKWLEIATESSHQMDDQVFQNIAAITAYLQTHTINMTASNTTFNAISSIHKQDKLFPELHLYLLF